MKPSDVFGIVVRIMGLVAVLLTFFFALDRVRMILERNQNRGIAFVIASVPGFFVGLWILLRARSLVSLAYPEEH
jgi:hypothetical protein